MHKLNLFVHKLRCKGYTRSIEDSWEILMNFPWNDCVRASVFLTLHRIACTRKNNSSEVSHICALNCLFFYFGTHNEFTNTEALPGVRRTCEDVYLAA